MVPKSCLIGAAPCIQCSEKLKPHRHPEEPSRGQEGSDAKDALEWETTAALDRAGLPDTAKLLGAGTGQQSSAQVAGCEIVKQKQPGSEHRVVDQRRNNRGGREGNREHEPCHSATAFLFLAQDLTARQPEEMSQMSRTKGRKQAKLMLREPGEAKGVLDLDGENSKKLAQPLIKEVPDAFAAAEKAGQFEFVTFDPGRKHLARVVAANGKKFIVRRFNKKMGEWQTKNESREAHACIPLTAAEAEQSFPGCVAAWEAAKLPDTLGAGATTIKEDNPNAAALVAAFKKNDHVMEAWRNEAAPMVKALENDLKESGEIWYGGKRYTSIKKWCEPALGIKYRAMRYRLTGGNPVSKRKRAGATVAAKAVTLKPGLVVKLEIGEQLYVLTKEPAINEKEGTRSFTLVVEPYEESKPAPTKPRKITHATPWTTLDWKHQQHPAAEPLEKAMGSPAQTAGVRCVARSVPPPSIK
jgi:hypothetical protein